MNCFFGKRIPAMPVKFYGSRQHGFTLLEAVFVILIIAVVLATAMQSASHWMQIRKSGNAADQFRFQLQRAKMLAIKEHTDVSVIIDIDKNQYFIARTSTNSLPVDAEKYALAQKTGSVVFKNESDNTTFIRFTPSGISPERGNVYIAAAEGKPVYRVRVTGAGGISKRRVVN